MHIKATNARHPPAASASPPRPRKDHPRRPLVRPPPTLSPPRPLSSLRLALAAARSLALGLVLRTNAPSDAPTSPSSSSSFSSFPRVTRTGGGGVSRLVRPVLHNHVHNLLRGDVFRANVRGVRTSVLHSIRTGIDPGTPPLFRPGRQVPVERHTRRRVRRRADARDVSTAPAALRLCDVKPPVVLRVRPPRGGDRGDRGDGPRRGGGVMELEPRHARDVDQKHRYSAGEHAKRVPPVILAPRLPVPLEAPVRPGGESPFLNSNANRLHRKR